MGWSTAPLAVKAAAIIAFVAVAAIFGIGTYDPADPHRLIQAAISASCGAVVAWLVLLAGNAATHPWMREQAMFWTSRETYTRRSAPLMAQLALVSAMSVTCMIYIFQTAETGSWLSAWTALLLFIGIVWPFIRYRIERGFWPD